MKNLVIKMIGIVLLVVILALPLQAEGDTNEIDLVTMHAPILSYHPDEGSQCCYPSNAEEAFLRLHPDGSLDELREPKTLIPNTPCYYQIARNIDTGSLGIITRIKYWFWYNFNDFPECIGGSHSGDWESVEVVLAADEQVYVYILSNHEGWLSFWPDEVILENGHIKVWAGNGSHANYPSSTYHVRCFPEWNPLCCDEIADGGSVWYTMSNLKAIEATNFAAYEGVWGKPLSPVVRQYEHLVLPGDHYVLDMDFHNDLSECDTTCGTWSWGPANYLFFDPGLKISAPCPDGGCLRFVGEPLACTRLRSYKVTESGILRCNIDIYDGEIRLYNTGSIRFIPSE